MRIAFLTPEFVTEPYFAGGLAQYLGRLVPTLVERGHEVEVFVTSHEENGIDYYGAKVWRVLPQRSLPLRIVNGLLSLVGRHKLIDTQRAWSTARGLDSSLRRRNQEIRFDIVQAASWMATGLFSVRHPVAPVVVRVSSYGPMLDDVAGTHASPDRRAFWALELAAMRKASAVYAPSWFLARRIASATRLNVNVVRPPFYVSTRAEDASVVHALAGFQPYVLFFGRISRYKGAGLLAEAVQPLLHELPGLHLAVVGPEGADETASRLLSLEHSFPHQVRYLGILPPDKLRPVVRAAHTVVLPSLADNLPNTCLEAMGLGQLVIGPNGVSFDELITDGESGLLFELGNAVSLRRTLLRAWRMSDETRIRIGQRAKARIAEVAPQKVLRDLESLYEKVIATAGRALRQGENV